MTNKTAAELEAGMAGVLDAPKDKGPVQLVVRRPGPGQREILTEAEFDLERGLIGDDWINRPGLKSNLPSPYAQVTLMNARYAELVAGPSHEQWALAGDQLYVDLDISHDNLPPGAHLQVGEVVLEIQPQPHTGCVQFSARFGSEALRATNTDAGRRLRLRGANASIIEPGTVRPGDTARKVQR